MNATDYGFKDESGIVILAPDYSKPAMAVLDKIDLADEKLDVRSAAMITRANAFVCTNPDQYKAGDLVVSECAALVKRIKEIHDPICVATNTAHKTATAARKVLIDPINQASKIIDAKLGNYKMEHDRKVAEENRLLEEKARKVQEEHALKQAAQMEEDGAPEDIVKAVLETANDPVQVAQSTAPDLASSNSRTRDWDIEVLDKNLIPEYYKTVNEGAIRTAVRSAKGNITVPGVRIIETFKTRRKSL